MFLKKIVYLFMTGLILSVTGCSAIKVKIPVTGEDQPSGAGTSLTNTHWRLVSYGEPGSETPILEGSEVTLQFEEGNKASGSGGCNTFGAQYKDGDGSNNLHISEVVSTEMACAEENLMQQESQYFAALESADSFELAGNSLTVHYGGGQGVLNFSRITSKIPNSVYL